MDLIGRIQPTVHTQAGGGVYTRVRHVIVLPLCRGDPQQFRVKTKKRALESIKGPERGPINPHPVQKTK